MRFVMQLVLHKINEKTVEISDFRAIITFVWKHSSAGMSVRLTRERSGVRASLLPLNVRRILCSERFWGYSSVGRAMRSQRIGQGFESPYLHYGMLWPEDSAS